MRGEKKSRKNFHYTWHRDVLLIFIVGEARRRRRWKMEITRDGREGRLWTDCPAVADVPTRLLPLLLQSLILVLIRPRIRFRHWVIPVRPRHFVPLPNVRRHMMARPLLVIPHVVQPGETPMAGPAGKLLLHPALVALMPSQTVVDRITPIASRTTILENRLWNTVLTSVAITRAYCWQATPPGLLLNIESESVVPSVSWKVSINRKNQDRKRHVSLIQSNQSWMLYIIM